MDQQHTELLRKIHGSLKSLNTTAAIIAVLLVVVIVLL